MQCDSQQQGKIVEAPLYHAKLVARCTVFVFADTIAILFA
jgi:hypothetical protein